MRRRVYVTQFDATWSLTHTAWHTLVKDAVAGKTFNLDDYGKQLSRPVSKWERQHKPLDWDAEAWADALEDIKSEDA